MWKTAMPNRLFAAPNFTIKLIPNIFRRGHHKGFIIGGVKGASINRHARMCACLTAQKINWRMIPWRTVSVHNEMDVPCGELHRQHTRTTQRNAVFDAFYPFDKFTPRVNLDRAKASPQGHNALEGVMSPSCQADPRPAGPYQRVKTEL